MKKIIFLLLSIAIVWFYNPKSLPRCDIYEIDRNYQRRILTDNQLDGQRQGVLVTRFFHNKANIFLHEYSKCYFNFYDFQSIFNSFGIFTLTFLIYFILYSLRKTSWHFMASLAVAPLLPIYFPNFYISFYAYKLFALLGLFFALKMKK